MLGFYRQGDWIIRVIRKTEQRSACRRWVPLFFDIALERPISNSDRETRNFVHAFDGQLDVEQFKI